MELSRQKWLWMAERNTSALDKLLDEAHVPREFAHAYITLTDKTEVMYQVSTAYTPGAERGLRWDDPALAVEWPVQPQIVSDKDAAWPLLSAAGSEGGPRLGAASVEAR